MASTPSTCPKCRGGTDVTDYARLNGYAGAGRVVVCDGRVTTHGDAEYHEWLARLREVAGKRIQMHDDIEPMMKANGWDYAYTVGYLSGMADRAHEYPRDIPLTAQDDFALGYHKGYSACQTP